MILFTKDLNIFHTNCKNTKREILKELPNDKILLKVTDDTNTLEISCRDINYSILIYKNEEHNHKIDE